MSRIVAVAAIAMIQLTDPNHGRVDLNANDIVTMRDATGANSLAEDVHCAITTVDGKFLSVLETCEQVRRLIDAAVKKGAAAKLPWRLIFDGAPVRDWRPLW